METPTKNITYGSHDVVELSLAVAGLVMGASGVLYGGSE